MAVSQKKNPARNSTSQYKSAKIKDQPARWRDVTQYFQTLDANNTGLNMLAKSLRTFLKPRNVLERLWCDDIIALTWQAHELRMIKRVVIFEGARDAVSQKIKHADQIDPRQEEYNDPGFDRKATQFIAAGSKDVTKKLVIAGVPSNISFEMGYIAKSYELEGFDRLIFGIEKRRDELIAKYEARQD